MSLSFFDWSLRAISRQSRPINARGDPSLALRDDGHLSSTFLYIWRLASGRKNRNTCGVSERGIIECGEIQSNSGHTLLWLREYMGDNQSTNHRRWGSHTHPFTLSDQFSHLPQEWAPAFDRCDPPKRITAWVHFFYVGLVGQQSERKQITMQMDSAESAKENGVAMGKDCSGQASFGTSTMADM